MTEVPFRPTKEQVAAAADRRIPDVLGPGLRVLFCGINPGLYSAAVGHHFARPGNRFWPALHRSGWTPRLLSPFEDATLPRYGAGLTNFVPRATAAAAELAPDELRRGAAALRRKVRRHRPGCVAILGLGAYRTAFGEEPTVGLQEETLAGRPLWVLPNPSGLNAHYGLDEFARLFGALRG